MKCRYEFEFGLGQSVKIKDYGIKGYVNAYWIERDGTIKYEIEWSVNGTINVRYFLSKELISMEK